MYPFTASSQLIIELLVSYFKQATHYYAHPSMIFCIYLVCVLSYLIMICPAASDSLHIFFGG